MKIKQIIKQIETLKEAIKTASTPEEVMNLQFEINRLENLEEE